MTSVYVTVNADDVSANIGYTTDGYPPEDIILSLTQLGAELAIRKQHCRICAGRYENNWRIQVSFDQDKYVPGLRNFLEEKMEQLKQKGLIEAAVLYSPIYSKPADLLPNSIHPNDWDTWVGNK